MKLNEVEVGGRYIAKVSGVLTTVKVLGIREIPPAYHASNQRWRKFIDVVNERTGRKTTFASAAKLRRRVDRPATPASVPPAPPTPAPTAGQEV